MRSLFHSPFPCTQPPSQQPSPTATAPLQPEMCYRPHPAPMHRQRRSPALLSAACPLPGPALTGPWPTVTRSQGACHAAPPSLPRAAARPHRAPSPEYRPAAPAPIGLASSASRPSRAVARIASTPLRAAIRIPLCRHRADSALIAPPSRPSCAAAVLHVLRASRPPCADIRVTPPISLLALRRPQGPGRQEPRRMHPFFAECAKKALFLATSARNACSSRSRWQHPRPMHPISGRNRAIQDTWRVNLAAKGPFSRRGARNHAWREDVASAARPFRGSGLRSGRMGLAPCGSGMRHAAWPNGLCALRRRPGLLAACAPPAISLVPAGAARAPTRANRVPAPRQPSLAHPWRHLRPPAPRHPPRLTLPRGFRCGSGNSCEMVR